MVFTVLFVNIQENTLASDDTLAHFFNDFLSLPVKQLLHFTPFLHFLHQNIPLKPM